MARWGFVEDFFGFLSPVFQDSSEYVGIFGKWASPGLGLYLNAKLATSDTGNGGGDVAMSIGGIAGGGEYKLALILYALRWKSSRSPNLGMRIKFRDTDQWIIWFGLVASTWFDIPPPAPDPNTSSDFVGFRFSSYGAPNGDWHWVHKVGGSTIDEISTLRGDTSEYHDLDFTLEPHQTLYRIDGKVVKAIVRDGPTTDLQLVLWAQRPMDGNTRVFYVDYIYGSQER